MTANIKNCKHLYLRAIIECMKCGQKMTNANMVKRTLKNDTYEFDTVNFIPYDLD